MSQFLEDGSTSDPTQKTLSNFFTSGEATHGSDINSDQFKPDSDTDLPIDISETSSHDLGDPSNLNENINFENPRESYEASEKRDSISSARQIEVDGNVRMIDRAHIVDNDVASSSNQGEENMWVDGYKCAKCGVELPPSFVEERQEHSDFHLAERLQKEESRNLPLTQRFIQKEEISSQSRAKKKHKSSPTGGKYLRIDSFFVNSSNSNKNS